MNNKNDNNNNNTVVAQQSTTTRTTTKPSNLGSTMHWKTTLASVVIRFFEFSIAFVLELTADRSSRSRATFQVRNALQFSKDKGDAKRIKLVSIDLEKIEYIR
jgi:hypothetical protein